MRRSISRLLIGLFAAPLMMISSAAWADTNPCGNFEFAASGQCEYVVSGGCTAQCEPISFQVVCDGQCTLTADVSCTGGCQAGCEADCNVNPGSFSCESECVATCQASCDSSCSDSGCVTSCKDQCTGRCSIDCKATPPSADCTAKCQASCDASCTVQANADCHFGCETDLKGGCELQCKEPEGALFCDGQYVDAADSFDACVAYLEGRGFLEVQVSAECSGGTCEASVSTGCAAAPGAGAVDDRLGVGAIAGMMIGLGMIASRRRRRA